MGLKHSVNRILARSRFVSYKNIEALTYPADRDILLAFAMQDEESKDFYVLNQLTALQKLPYPQEREIYRKVFENTKGSSSVRSYLLKTMTWPEDREQLLWSAENEGNWIYRRLAQDKIPLRMVGEKYLEEAMRTTGKDKLLPEELHAAQKAAVLLAEWPPEGDHTRFLQMSIARGVNAYVTTPPLIMDVSAYRRDLITLAGWSAAALGRAVTRDMKPDDLARMLSVSGGTSEEDVSLAYLAGLLRDNQSRIPRFIKQGVIMGLLDWLLEHRDHPEAEKLLETAVAVRNDMVRSDHELTFFEVRVPGKTCREDYAVILADVLHCANPSLSFCDTEELLSVAEREVPGCMEMLWACPLRLIDPVNRQTLGFYQFKPYAHEMWVQFKPPKGEGQVIARYHEVDDRTRPLSSGLSLALFRDPWAVIPTIFHEHQHFRGDRNEASVFLKTQLFSVAFYKKYPAANAAADGVFAQMTSMLGLPPEAAKRDALNGIIERFYGKQVSEADAESMAEMELERLNRMIRATNDSQTWDPSVKYPLLACGESEKQDGDLLDGLLPLSNRPGGFIQDGLWSFLTASAPDREDRESGNIIRDAVIRFATAPKSVTAEEFEAIVRGDT